MSIYDTQVLIQVVENMIRPSSFLLDTFFANVVTFDTEEVAIDVDTGKRRISPLVTPMMQGRVVEGRSFTTNVIKPAYVKDKRSIDPKKPVKRALGERLSGNLTGAEREAANLDYELTDQMEMLTRRMELMAADSLLDGKLALEILGHGTVEVDFGRAAGNTVVLLTTARWGESGVSPADDVEAWATQVLKESGVAPTDIVFTPEAWDLFKADPKVKDALDVRRGGNSQIELGAQVQVGAVFKGDYGNFRLWVYNEWYVDESDVEQRMLPAYSVIMTSPRLDGTRAFGMIKDPKAAYQPMEYFPKSWIEEDPPVRWLMLQSAPIVIPSRVNASFAATVR